LQQSAHTVHHHPAGPTWPWRWPQRYGTRRRGGRVLVAVHGSLCR